METFQKRTVGFWIIDCCLPTLKCAVKTDLNLLSWRQEVSLWTGLSSEPSIEGIGPTSTEILTKYDKLREVEQHQNPSLVFND